MLIICFIAYMTALFMLEAISVAHAVGDLDEKSQAAAGPEEGQRDSMFSQNQYKTPIVKRRQFLKDLGTKQSPFYIREKIEISIIAKRIAKPWLQYVIIVMIILYMYGSICLKFVSGAESFDLGFAYTFWGHKEGFRDAIGFDPYYIGICIGAAQHPATRVPEWQEHRSAASVTTMLAAAEFSERPSEQIQKGGEEGEGDPEEEK